jgi:hypothetical protein
LEQGYQNGNTCGNQRATILGQTGKIELFNPLLCNHARLELLKLRQGDYAIVIVGDQQFPHRLDTARATQAAFPSQLLILSQDWLQLV